MKFASLYSGCGGFDLGFLDEGFKHVGAYDNDPIACENFKNNVSEKITQFDLTQGLPNPETLSTLDALIAGPPCQGFSTAGKRRFNDERNHLLTLTAQLALGIYPKVLVVENVPGALAGQHFKYWSTMDQIMQGAGYRTHTIQCHTSDLGMAQTRKRMLFFAWRTQKEISFQFQHTSLSTLWDAISTVKRGCINHRPTRLVPSSKEWLIAAKIKPGQKLSNVRGGVNAVACWDIPEVFGHVTNEQRTILELLRRLRRQNRQRKYGDADPVSFSRLEQALGQTFQEHIRQLIAKGYLKEINGQVDLTGTFNGKYRRLDWQKPSHTVDTRFGTPRYFLHPEYPRGFTVREAARIQGFTDSYIFSGKEQAQYRVIGNAVPPPLGKLAAQLTKRLLGKPK